MNAKEQIREALQQIMLSGEANACLIYKSDRYWHYCRFGKTPTRLEKSLADSLAAIAEIAESFEK